MAPQKSKYVYEKQWSTYIKYKCLNNIVSVYINILYECPHFWLNTMFC